MCIKHVRPEVSPVPTCPSCHRHSFALDLAHASRLRPEKLRAVFVIRAVNARLAAVAETNHLPRPRPRIASPRLRPALALASRLWPEKLRAVFVVRAVKTSLAARHICSRSHRKQTGFPVRVNFSLTSHSGTGVPEAAPPPPYRAHSASP
ncbi:hypothetical protein IWX49DRAFT_325329 [Phyllosticta citricarpa]|uniref:Uncharacterized protein n=1 Tax=Phyllosticta citricarpa TaxID=55181 RepID=A0ABR1LPR9_9PEZI